MIDVPIIVLQAFDLWAFLDEFYIFVAVYILMVAGIISMLSGSMSVGSLSAFSLFSVFGSQTGDTFLENILITVLVLSIVGLSFKLWRLEGMD